MLAVGLPARGVLHVCPSCLFRFLMRWATRDFGSRGRQMTGSERWISRATNAGDSFDGELKARARDFKHCEGVISYRLRVDERHAGRGRKDASSPNRTTWKHVVLNLTLTLTWVCSQLLNLFHNLSTQRSCLFCCCCLFQKLARSQSFAGLRQARWGPRRTARVVPTAQHNINSRHLQHGLAVQKAETVAATFGCAGRRTSARWPSLFCVFHICFFP